MSGKIKTVLISLTTLLVIVLAVGIVFKYTKAGDKIKDLFNPAFRVEYDGKDYTGENNVIALPFEGQAAFTVKGSESYRVKIMPNVTDETDFNFSVGDTVYTYGQADLNKVFLGGNNVKNGKFYINCLNDYSLESVLSMIYGGAVALYKSVEYPYLLTFTDDSGETVSFIFGQSDFNIKLSESNINF